MCNKKTVYFILNEFEYKYVCMIKIFILLKTHKYGIYVNQIKNIEILEQRSFKYYVE